MKDIINKIKIYFKSINKKTYRKKYISPQKDWFIAVLFTFITAVIIGALSLYFFTVLNSDFFWKVPERQAERYDLNKKNLEKFSKILSEKEKIFDDVDNDLPSNPFK